MKKDKAINLAIDNVIKEGLTDIFDRPFELEFLNNDGFRKEVFSEVLTSLKEYNLSNLKINPLEYVLMPKKELFDFRRCALVNPLDTIKYTALILLVADEIEKKRISVKRKRVFSYRFKPENGYLFDKNYNYSSYKNYVDNKIRQDKVKILIECDISNFYDRLNLHRLESILRSIDEIDDRIVNLINQLLLFWANRDSYGLPVGGNASRILAEASLIEVDNYLISKGVQFARFVDDYRIFAPNASVGNKWLSMLVNKLSREGLFLNTRKTIFKDVSDIHKENNSKEKDIKMKEENQNVQPMSVISSYSGIIPRKFRESSEAEIEEIRKTIDVNKVYNLISKSTVIDPKYFKLLIKTIIYQEKYELLTNIPKILESSPQFIPYVTDVLIKYKDNIPDEIAVDLRDKFSKWFKENELPEYILVYIAKLIGEEKYRNIEAIFDAFVNLKRNSGSYIGRVLLEELEGNISRGRVLEIKEYYSRSNSWEKRAITEIIYKDLAEGENRPWLKNIEINSNDIFEKGIFKNYKPPKMKKNK
ncbi:RNA-directed DNA polymerase [Clostridium butyricum]|uniref:RNA-directed DNA polymerase n=1 Tax=Clostridium butyricum TaxID=1492 RepID=UPI003466282B